MEKDGPLNLAQLISIAEEQRRGSKVLGGYRKEEAK